MLVTILFVVTGLLYGVASVLYLVFLLRGADKIGRYATGALIGAVAVHVGLLAADFFVAGHVPTADIQQTLALASLVTVVAYLLALTRYKLTVLGAFITPITLLLFLGAGLGRTVAHVPPGVRSILLPIHIGVNVLGIAAFTLAFAVALAYVIQERQLRRKQLGAIFHRLPPLDTLDALGLKLVTIGIPLLTFGIVTGTMVATQNHGALELSTAQILALLAWLFFAGVLLLRWAAGWRGRRAAIGMMLGFFCTMAVLVGYVLRASARGP